MTFQFSKYKGCRITGGLFLLFAILLSSCQLIFPFKKKVKLAQLWLIDSGTFSNVRSATMLQLNDDSTYTLLSLTGADSGRWQQDGNRIFLQKLAGSSQAEEIYLQYKTVKASQLEIKEFQDESFDPTRIATILKAVALGKKKKADPAGFYMNRWRIMPDSSESPQAIKNRTLAYLQFLAACYQFAIDTKLETLPTDWFPQPIQMHFSNGVRMAYANELDDWNACFYNEKEATQGYMYISAALRKIRLKTTENKFDRNLDCIQQLLTEIQQMDTLPPAEESNTKTTAN